MGGHDVRDYSIEALRDQVAIVLQKNVLFAGTIAQNLRWGNSDATNEQLKEVCQMAQADSFIQEFPDGYNTHLSKVERISQADKGSVSLFLLLEQL